MICLRLRRIVHGARKHAQTPENGKRAQSLLEQIRDFEISPDVLKVCAPRNERGAGKARDDADDGMERAHRGGGRAARPRAAHRKP